MSSGECSFTGKTKGLVWHLTPNGYPACTGGIAPILSAGTALAFFSTCLLTCQILYTFTSYRNLYFWSLIITSWALSLHAIGLLLMYVGDPMQWRAYITILFLGWICMTTGFSMVLYSRLHLLDVTRRWSRIILVMIAVVAAINLSVSVVMERLPALAKDHVPWLKAWSIWHHVRPVIFFVEDVVLSSLYLKAAFEYMRSPRSPRSNWLGVKQNRQAASLIALQVLVWILDLAIIGCALARLFVLIDIITSFVYAVKLKLEFAFLEHLVAISGAAQQAELGTVRSLDEELGCETPIGGTSMRPVIERMEPPSENDHLQSVTTKQPTYKTAETADSRC